MSEEDASTFQELTGSILTPSQREFLRNGRAEGQSPASIRMLKSRIRDRLGAAMVDFSLLLDSEYLDIEDFGAAFTERVDIQFPPVPAELIQEAIAVLFLGSLAAAESTDDGSDDIEAAVNRFEEQLRSGLERAVTRRGQRVSDLSLEIELTIEAEAVPDDSVELYELSADHLDRLRLANHITEREYVDAIVTRHQKEPVGEDRVETSSDRAAE